MEISNNVVEYHSAVCTVNCRPVMSTNPSRDITNLLLYGPGDFAHQVYRDETVRGSLPKEIPSQIKVVLGGPSVGL